MSRSPGDTPLYGARKIPLSAKTGLLHKINEYLRADGRGIEQCITMSSIYGKPTYSFERLIEDDELLYAIDSHLLEARMRNTGKHLVTMNNIEVPLKMLLAPIINQRYGHIRSSLISAPHLMSRYEENYIRDGNLVLVAQQVIAVPIETFTTADMKIKATAGGFFNPGKVSIFGTYGSGSIIKVSEVPKELTLEDYKNALPEWLERNKDK